MIKLLYFEIQKLLSKRNFIIILLLLISLQFFILFIEQNQSENPLAQNDHLYTQIKEETVDKTISEKYIIFKQKHTFLTNVKAYENEALNPFDTDEVNSLDFIDEKFIKEYNAFLMSDEYAFKDEYLSVYNYLSAYYDDLVHYEQYITGISEKAKELKESSAWNPISNAKIAELDLVISKYHSLKNRQLSDQGIQMWEHYATSQSGVLIIFIWLFIAIAVVSVDEYNDMDSLIQTTNKGDIRLWSAKLMTMIIFGIIATLIVEVGNLFILSSFYGNGSWEATIQSIPFFYTSPYPFTIIQWYILSFFLKIILCFSVTSVFTLLYSFLKKGAFIVLAIIFGISFILYLTINTNSNLNVLHYVNLFYVMNVSNIYREFVLFNFASFYLYLPQIIWVLTIIIILLFSVLYIMFANKKLRIPTKQISLPIFAHTKLWLHEMEKIMINNKMFIICMLFLLMQGYYMIQGFHNASSVNESNQQLVELYEQYGGELSDDKRELIEKQYNEYKIEEENLILASQQFKAGWISEEEHQSLLKEYMQSGKKRNTFKIFYANYLQAKTHIVYTKGYQAIFGINTDTRDARLSLFISGTLLFALYGLYTIDQYQQEDDLYLTTMKGKNRRYRSKEKCAFIIAIISFLFYFGSDFLMFSKLYPMFQWDAPFYEVLQENTMITSSLSLDIPIWQYACLLYLVRFIGVCLCTLFIMVISKKVDNMISSIFIGSIVLFMPMILFNINMDFVLLFSVFDLLQGNLFLQHSLFWFKIIILLVIGVLIYIRSLRKIN